VAAPKSAESFADRRWSIFPYVMILMVLFTIISLFHVWSRVRVIELSLQSSDARRQLKDAQQENNRLRLEVASLKTPARIEALAKGELGMQIPAEKQVVVVK